MISRLKRVLYLQILYWPMRLTGLLPKYSQRLLEAMQEHQVTIGDSTFKLPEPFLVLGHSEPDRAGRNLSFTGSTGG